MSSCLSVKNNEVAVSSSNDDLSRSGIVTADTERTVLLFEDSKFRNNTASSSDASGNAWAIRSPGPMTIQDSCFTDNAFLGLSPVISVGYPEVDVSNNYGITNTTTTSCPFLFKIPGDDTNLIDDVTTSRQNGTAPIFFVCVDYDASHCQAVSPPTLAPSVMPSGQPSGSPIAPPSYWDIERTESPTGTSDATTVGIRTPIHLFVSVTMVSVITAIL